MAIDIVLGRSAADKEKFGMAGTVLIGKQYVKMGQITSLANPVYMDVARAHVVYICGKRGSGKSYTMGAIAEGMVDLPPDVSKNLSIIMLDTMGVYWTMKYPNHKDEDLLREWGFKGKGLGIVIYTPFGYYEQYKKQGIPTDHPFSLKPSELSAADWSMTFDVSPNDPIGVLIERVINDLAKKKATGYSIKDIVSAIQADKRSEQPVKDAAENHFLNADNWGLFSDKGTSIHELAQGGKVTVLDMSCYATQPNGWAIKALAMGLIAQKLFVQRMEARKIEEYDAIQDAEHYFAGERREEKEKMPLVWLIIDEAHEFMPVKGKTAATDALVTILREGRQPGISLILATQQPGKIHTDVMTQSDIVISHRITAKLDTDALGMLAQTYMREGLDKQLNILPRVKGSAVVLDDQNERLFSIRIRPRFTWHGGESPVAVKAKKKEFQF